MAEYRSHYKKAKRTEAIARRHIELLGYENTVSSPSAGPDVIGFKLGRAYTFEVKPVQKQRGARSWLVPPVEPARRQDHFIAIVLPNDEVIVEPMPHHLAKCSKSGARTVTTLIRERCPEIYEGRAK